jgi:hypothetical protein
MVAHELRWLGTPLVLSPIPPFTDCFEQGEDAVFYDGTPADLADVMAKLFSGELEMSGRTGVADLCVDAPRFAEVYRGLVQEGLPKAEPAPADRPLVSVVVAHGGKAEPLERTVRSVLASSYREVEVAVVDWGDPAASAQKALRSMGAEAADGRVKPLGRCLGERGAAFNMALDRVEGEFVLFLDPGCAVSEQYIELAVAAHRRCPEAAFISCFSRAREKVDAGRWRLDVPYGLDPVLIALEDGAGLKNAVFRREIFGRDGLRFSDALYAQESWELGWSLAERGLCGDVLPQVHVSCEGCRDEWVGRRLGLERFHIRQRMADLHPALIAQQPSALLKAHQTFTAGPGEEVLTDSWLLKNYRGLRLIRVGLRKCAREGPRGVLVHVLSKVRQKIPKLWQRITDRLGGRSGG